MVSFRSRWLGVALALAACGGAWAARPITFTQTARLSLDANGKVVSAVFDEGKPGFAKLDAKLEQFVHGWSFAPGTVDGKPLPTETNLSINLRATPAGNGDYAISILGASTGLVFQRSAPPEYPSSAMQQGCEGVVIMLVDIDGTGAPMGTRIESNDVDCMKTRLETAAIDAARQWRFRTESVGGHAMAGRARVPVTFCLGLSHGACARYYVKEEKDNQRGADGQPAADTQPAQGMQITSLGSKVKLLTQVAGTSLQDAAVP